VSVPRPLFVLFRFRTPYCFFLHHGPDPNDSNVNSIDGFNSVSAYVRRETQSRAGYPDSSGPIPPVARGIRQRTDTDLGTPFGRKRTLTASGRYTASFPHRPPAPASNKPTPAPAPAYAATPYDLALCGRLFLPDQTNVRIGALLWTAAQQATGPISTSPFLTTRPSNTGTTQNTRSFDVGIGALGMPNSRAPTASQVVSLQLRRAMRHRPSWESRHPIGVAVDVRAKRVWRGGIPMGAAKKKRSPLPVQSPGRSDLQQINKNKKFLKRC